MKILKKYKGVSLIEIILAIGIIAIFTTSTLSLFFTTEYSEVISSDQEVAMNYAVEGLEIMSNIADQNFLNLNDGAGALAAAGTSYSFVLGGTEILDDYYEREVNVEPVTRNDANQITEGGENQDNSTKKVTLTVSWTGSYLTTKSVVLQRYLTDWSGITWTQTTLTDFNGGATDDTIALESDLAIIDNGKVELDDTSSEITFFESANVQEHARDVYFENNIIYAAVGKATGGFCTIDATDPTDIDVLDCIDVGGKGNDVVVSGNYAYVANDKISKGLAIVNISNPSNLSITKTLNVGGEVTSVDKIGSYVYLSVNKSTGGFVVVNVSSPSTASVASTVNVGATATDIKASGNYAYLSLSNNNFKIYSISNPNSPSLQSTTNLGVVGKGAAYESSYIYLGTSSASQGLKVINVADPAAPLVVDTYNLGKGVNDVAISGDYLFLASDDAQGAATIYDKSDPLDLTYVDEIDVGGKGNGLFATDSYVFYAVDTANQGIGIISTATQILATAGAFASSVHDTGAEGYEIQSISWLSSDPPGTTLEFQIRTADSAANILNATYVGPDGTDQTYYSTTPDIIELDPLRTGQRFIQWKAYFVSDGNSTPSLEEVTIKYE